ncbi:hypothetical protein B9Z19DRAFT_1078060, partial [Tuber borchii]
MELQKQLLQQRVISPVPHCAVPISVTQEINAAGSKQQSILGFSFSFRLSARGGGGKGVSLRGLLRFYSFSIFERIPASAYLPTKYRILFLILFLLLLPLLFFSSFFLFLFCSSSKKHPSLLHPSIHSFPPSTRSTITLTIIFNFPPLLSPEF